jgi:hypothetical protein
VYDHPASFQVMVSAILLKMYQANLFPKSDKLMDMIEIKTLINRTDPVHRSSQTLYSKKTD